MITAVAWLSGCASTGGDGWRLLDKDLRAIPFEVSRADGEHCTATGGLY
jgi:hypothetical protein